MQYFHVITALIDLKAFIFVSSFFKYTFNFNDSVFANRKGNPLCAFGFDHALF